MKEQTDNDVAVVEMFKADPVDTSIFTSIADDITRICSTMRYLLVLVSVCLDTLRLN